MPAPTHPALASRLGTCLVGRARLIGRIFVQTWHQARAARPVPQESRLSRLQHAQKAAASPASQQPGIPYNPLYDLPALPPFRSAEASLGMGKCTIMLSAQVSATLDATLRQLRPLLEVSQRRQLSTERLIEVCLLMSVSDVQTHGPDSQIVKILGQQVAGQPARRERGED